MIKLKSCPDLKQIETKAGFALGGQARTVSEFSPCINKNCAAFDRERGRFFCRKFGTYLEIHEDKEEDKHE